MFSRYILLNIVIYPVLLATPGEKHLSSSDESDDVTEDEDAENEEVARFLLGSSSSTHLSSIGVQKIFQNLGLSPTLFLRSTNFTKKHKGFLKSGSDKEQEDIPIDVVGGCSNLIHGLPPPPLSKIRLTYGDETFPPKEDRHRKTSSNINKEDLSVLHTKPLLSESENKPAASQSANCNKIKISTSSFTHQIQQSLLKSNIRTSMDKTSSNTGTGGISSGSTPVTSAEKRPLPTAQEEQPQADENITEEETKKKKQKTNATSSVPSSNSPAPTNTTACTTSTSVGTSKKDDDNKDSSNSTASNAGTTSGSSSAGAAVGKSSRSTRGSSSEKSTGIVLMK